MIKTTFLKKHQAQCMHHDHASISIASDCTSCYVQSVAYYYMYLWSWGMKCTDRPSSNGSQHNISTPKKVTFILSLWHHQLHFSLIYWSTNNFLPDQEPFNPTSEWGNSVNNINCRAGFVNTRYMQYLFSFFITFLTPPWC